jgi:mitochondrial fission protein ELM1
LSESPSVSHDLEESWPFFRDDPDRVVLGPLPGVTPSAKPPVRIFLGTEEAQYRAQRIFFYSILQVRDPARTYEVHLMNNIRGFDRRRWRTGFTNYRYAIPDFAGRAGKAVYNDVDQIYLADPALLFDLEMGEHGYLAISASDTSVMLIDCERMWPIWNREVAATGSKHALLAKPKAMPGLWGALDPQWNARDQEYVEGLTKCLHYTALHQQPWQPFPDDYSYHPNPLAYIWHDLEHRADAEAYRVFTRERPSPELEARLGTSGRGDETGRAPLPAPSKGAVALARALGINSALVVSALDPAGIDTSGLGLGERSSLKVRGGDAWPDEPADAVIAADLLEHVPPADIAWLLDEIFARARRLVLLEVRATAADGLGSAAWWQLRLAEAAERRPGVSWHLDAVGSAGEVHSTGAHRVADPGTPVVWLLTDADRPDSGPAIGLAEALGWPWETKRLAMRARSRLPAALRGASLAGLDRSLSSPLDPPWPGLVVTSDAAAVPIARWIRAQAGGNVRLVHLGRPDAPFEVFDLIVAGPEERLPIRPNVIHVTAPLAGMDRSALAAATEIWKGRIGERARPWGALFLPQVRFPFVLSVTEAAELGRVAGREAKEAGGTLLLLVEPGVGEGLVAAVTGATGCETLVLRPAAGEARTARAALLALADRAIVTGIDTETLAEASLMERPTAVFQLRRWHEGKPLAEPLVKALTLLTGGGTSYRGTPHQQHVVGRLVDRATASGLLSLPRDPAALVRALVARGLVTRIGDGHAMAGRKPLDDLRLAVERIRRLMSERRQAGHSRA